MIKNTKWFLLETKNKDSFFCKINDSFVIRSFVNENEEYIPYDIYFITDETVLLNNWGLCVDTLSTFLNDDSVNSNLLSISPNSKKIVFSTDKKINDQKISCDILFDILFQANFYGKFYGDALIQMTDQQFYKENEIHLIFKETDYMNRCFDKKNNLLGLVNTSDIYRIPFINDNKVNIKLIPNNLNIEKLKYNIEDKDNFNEILFNIITNSYENI